MSNIFNKKIIFLFLFLSIFKCAEANGNAVFLADDSIESSFCGIISRELHFGPPSFGENPNKDLKIYVWFVDLEQSTLFRYKNYKNINVENRLKKIQLSLDSQEFNKNLYKYSGKRVMVSGKLWSATSQGDMTSVVIAPSEIKLIDKSISCK